MFDEEQEENDIEDQSPRNTPDAAAGRDGEGAQDLLDDNVKEYHA